MSSESGISSNLTGLNTGFLGASLKGLIFNCGDMERPASSMQSGVFAILSFNGLLIVSASSPMSATDFVGRLGDTVASPAILAESGYGDYDVCGLTAGCCFPNVSDQSCGQ